MRTLNQQKDVLLGVSVIMLLLALLDGWQYGFFTFLRFVVFATCGYVAYLALTAEQNSFWVWALGGIAVLFNPFIPIYLTREVWVVIDFLVAIFLLTTMVLLRLPKHPDAGEIESGEQ